MSTWGKLGGGTRLLHSNIPTISILLPKAFSYNHILLLKPMKTSVKHKYIFSAKKSLFLSTLVY